MSSATFSIDESRPDSKVTRTKRFSMRNGDPSSETTPLALSSMTTRGPDDSSRIMSKFTNANGCKRFSATETRFVPEMLRNGLGATWKRTVRRQTLFSIGPTNLNV